MLTLAPIQARATICTVLHTAFTICRYMSGLLGTPLVAQLVMLQVLMRLECLAGGR